MGPAQVEGKSCWKVKFEGHIKLGDEKAAASDNPVAALLNIKGQIDVTGEAMLDQADCSIVSLDTKTRSELMLPAFGKPGAGTKLVDVTQLSQKLAP